MAADDLVPESPGEATQDSISPDIPININNGIRWVTGLTNRTTCDDVIYALLYNDGNHGGETTEDYAIFERWRDVEKPLQARTKIVKVWRAWGAEQSNVMLCVKKVHDSLHNRRRQRRKSRHQNGCGCRPGAHKNCYTSGRTRSLESLVKLVIIQERKLRELDERINRTDTKIDNLETRRHVTRMKQNGVDYVQSAYLDSLSEDSMDEIFGNVNADDIEDYIACCERIIHLEDRLVSEQKHVTELNTLVQESIGEACSSGDSIESNMPIDELVEHARVAVTRIVSAGMMQRYDEEAVKQELTSCDVQLETKRRLIRSLKDEIIYMENEVTVPEVCYSNGHEPYFDYKPTIANRRTVSNTYRNRLNNGAYPNDSPPTSQTRTSHNTQQFVRSDAVHVQGGHPVLNNDACLTHADFSAHNNSAHVQSLSSVTDDDDDDDDRVSVIQIFDAPPNGRSKSVTFNDRLNHMHVIGTSKEHLATIPKGKQASKEKCNTFYPSHPVSILKNNFRHNNDLISGETTLSNGASEYGRYHLPTGMYTFAKDGMYSILDPSQRPYKDEDSNSDTGLSSMHSDESTGLETLV